MITYRTGNDIDLDAFIRVFEKSTLAERRPADDRDRMAEMLQEANLVITAWDGDELVGLARSITDHAYCTYLSDLAVLVDYQAQGIGRELMRQTQSAAPRAILILLAAPAAVAYYPKVGMKKHESAWILMPGEEFV